jgi:response regulator RpfG family c-di-GMP phosphodiesterase
MGDPDMHAPYDDTAAEAWPDMALGTPAPTAAATVLCVDDEPNVVSALARVFHREHYHVLTATSAKGALEILGRQHVNVVLSDMRMPHMDGAAFLEEVSLRWPRIARILLTGYNDLQAAVAAINRGEIFRYLFKPWDDDEMRLTVRQALERQEVEEERRHRHDLARRRVARLAVSNDDLEERVADRTEELRRAEHSLRKAHTALEAAYVTTVRLFASLAETGVDPTRGYGRRVADDAQLAAVRMGFDPVSARNVLFAGLLHEIGRVGLPRPLRAKPEEWLTRDEAAQVHGHPVVAEAMLMGLPPLQGAAFLVRHHHECYDGTGYPDGLKGDDIPAGARVIAVASDFHALCAGLITGEAIPGNQAAAFLIEHRGTRYDPACVDAFLSVTGREPDTGRRVQEGAPEEVALRPDALRPGMVLAADLMTHQGVVLLTRHRALDQSLIDQLREFEREAGWHLEVLIASDAGGSP